MGELDSKRTEQGIRSDVNYATLHLHWLFATLHLKRRKNDTG